MKLIDNASAAWRFLSIQLAILAGLINAAQQIIPVVQQWIPSDKMVVINSALALAIVVARILKQEHLIPDVCVTDGSSSPEAIAPAAPAADPAVPATPKGST